MNLVYTFTSHIFLPILILYFHLCLSPKRLSSKSFPTKILHWLIVYAMGGTVHYVRLNQIWNRIPFILHKNLKMNHFCATVDASVGSSDRKDATSHLSNFGTKFYACNYVAIEWPEPTRRMGTPDVRRFTGCPAITPHWTPSDPTRGNIRKAASDLILETEQFNPFEALKSSMLSRQCPIDVGQGNWKRTLVGKQ